MRPLVVLLLLLASTLRAAPLREVRAVWIATAAGLDWPTTSDRTQQQSSLRGIVEQLARAHFNTIFFQARPRGDALYRSQHEPWAENLSGTMGKDPGWDPLAFLIRESHKRGIEVHAWVNVFKVRSNNAWPPSVQHPLRKFPQWVVHYQGEDWMDPGFPGVRTYTLNVILDMVRNYDLDGVNMDFARYPDADFPDDVSYRQYGYRMPKDEWRVRNISGFVAALYDSVTAVKPWVKVGSSPLGVPASKLDRRTAATLRKYSQDAPAWLREEKQDYISPQIYWSIGEKQGNPDFARLVKKWSGLAAGRQVIAGIAAYKPEVLRELAAEIAASREGGAVGEAYFRYGNLFPTGRTQPVATNGGEYVDAIDLVAGRPNGSGGPAGSNGSGHGGADLYSTPALIPPMPWKDATPPLAVGNMGAVELSPGVFQIEWAASKRAEDGDRAAHYVVRRSAAPSVDADDPATIAAVVPGGSTVWTDTIAVPSVTHLYYMVSALDRGNNESQPSPVAEATLVEAVALRSALHPEEAPALVVDTLSPGKLYAAYRLPARVPVVLDLVRRLPNGTTEIIASPVRGVQDAGTYLVALPGMTGRESGVTVRLKAGGRTLETRAE